MQVLCFVYMYADNPYIYYLSTLCIQLSLIEDGSDLQQIHGESS